MLISQLGQTIQTEYGLAYALTISLIVLGLLAVCIPRPRKPVIDDESESGTIRKPKPKRR